MSSSSSSSENFYLSNIEAFRSYSLDADLVELFFNKGVFYESIDLDLSVDSSSSSSEPSDFLLRLRVAMRSGGVVPSGLQIYLFDESVGGVSSPGAFSASWASADLAEVRLSGGAMDGLSGLSFRINIEGSTIYPARLGFEVSTGGVGEIALSLSEAPPGRGLGRLTESYKQYLIGWIVDFWDSWDSGGGVPDFSPPFPGSFDPFDPFAHARWRLDSDFAGALSGYSTDVEFSPGNRGLIEGLNPLSVSRSTWECIARDLYEFQGYTWSNALFTGITLIDFVTGDYRRDYRDPDYSFDCRSFAVWGASYLRRLLSGVCPEALVKVISIGSHFLNYVDLGGSDPCCTGKFMWEPQNGAVYYDVKDSVGYSWIYPKPTTVYEPLRENSDGDFGEPNWELDTGPGGQLERMSGVICGCVSAGGWDAGSREEELKGVCDGGGMKQWLVDNLSFTVDDGDPSSGVKFPGIEPREDTGCRACLMEWTASWDCSSAEEGWEVEERPYFSVIPLESLPPSPPKWAFGESGCEISLKVGLPPRPDESLLAGAAAFGAAGSTMCLTDSCCEGKRSEMSAMIDDEVASEDLTDPTGCCEKIKALRFGDQ
jgi:hypothetical protein